MDHSGSGTSGTAAASTIGLQYIEERNRNVVVHQNAVDYDDVIRLFTHRHTATLFKRQAAAFRQIAREKKAGLKMSDIDPVCRVVQLGLERLADLSAEGLPSEVFVKPLCSLLRLFGLPFVKSKAYEEFDNGASLALALSTLVRALSADSPDFVHAVSQTVMGFTAHRTAREFDLRCELVAESGLVEALVLCMQRNAADLSTALPLVTACRQLATIPTLALQFDAGIFGVLTNLLERDFRETLVLEVVQLLWLLFDQEDDTSVSGLQKARTLKSSLGYTSTSEVKTAQSGSQAAILAFANMRSITVLAELLRQSFRDGYKATDKQVRNDIVVLLILVTRVQETQKLVDECGIFEELIGHATQYEMHLIAQAEKGALAEALANTRSTVGLGKIRALRTQSSAAATQQLQHDGGSVSPLRNAAVNNGDPYALTSDFLVSSEDFQLKLLLWQLIGACAAGDQACHSRVVRGSGGAPVSAPIQAALLYLDAARAYNLRSLDDARKAEAKRRAQNQAMTGLLAAKATMEGGGVLGAEGEKIPNLTKAALALIGKLKYSQLLHLQSSALSLLSLLVPSSFESFKQVKGLERVLEFAVEVAENPVDSSVGGPESGVGGDEEKRLNASSQSALQAGAVKILVRFAHAGQRQAAVCPVKIGNAGLDEIEQKTFSRTSGGDFSSTTNGILSSSSGEFDPTVARANHELQELLETDVDEAYQAVLKARQQANGVSHSASASGSRGTLLASQQQGGNGGALEASPDSSTILSTLLRLFLDASTSSDLRADALSTVSLLLARSPVLQKQFRLLQGVHALVQFLNNDGARAAAGLDPVVGGTVELGATLATTAPATQANLLVYAAKAPQLLLAVIDCIWASCIGVRASTELFLALNGLDLLLDLLLILPSSLRPRVLSLLADFLHSSSSSSSSSSTAAATAEQARKFVFEWRSGPGRTIPDGGKATAEANIVLGQLSHSLNKSQYSSAASLPTLAQLGSSSEIEGFTALDLLLSFWPEPDLAEKEELGQAIAATEDDPSALIAEGDDNADKKATDAAWYSSDEESTGDLHAADRAARLNSTLSSLPRITSNQTLRPALYAIFSALGFADDNPFLLAASPVQRGQLFAIAHYLDSLRSGAFTRVAEQLESEGVQLVEEDRVFLEEHAQLTANAREEAELFAQEQWHAQREKDTQEITRYLHSITSRKVQSETFLLQSARRARKQTMRRRLLYKEMRQQMLKNSADQTRPSRQGSRPKTGPASDEEIQKRMAPPVVSGGSPRAAFGGSPRASEQKRLSGTKSIASSPVAAARATSLQKKATEEEKWNDEEEQKRLDDEEDVELEQRLLQSLDASLPSPLSPSGNPIQLASPTSGDFDTPRSTDSPLAQHLGNGIGATKGRAGKLVVSQMDPLAEQMLVAARLQQRERQAAISAALAKQPSTTRTSSRTVNSQSTVRTTTSVATSQLVGPNRKK